MRLFNLHYECKPIGHSIYGEFLRHLRIRFNEVAMGYSVLYEKYKNDAPSELLKMLDLPQIADWTWGYFTFDNNASLTEEKKMQIFESVPIGTKL